MTNTRGRQQLLKSLSGDKTQAALARDLKLSAHSVWNWCQGITRPEHHHRLALHGLVGIDPLSWLTAEEMKTAQKFAPVTAKAA